MEILLEPNTATYQIKRIEANRIQVNEQWFTTSFMITKDQYSFWPLSKIEDFTEAHLKSLLEFKPSLILLGTGTYSLPLKPEYLAHIYQAGIGLETMNTPAACRTYNLLVAEGRSVLAGLIIPLALENAQV